MFHDYSKTLLAQITATISLFVFSAPRPVAQALLIAQVASYQSRTITCGILFGKDRADIFVQQAWGLTRHGEGQWPSPRYSFLAVSLFSRRYKVATFGIVDYFGHQHNPK